MVRTSRSITATKALVLGMCLWAGASAVAEPSIQIVEKPYPVDATTLEGLRWQMSSRGPFRFWAFTRGKVAWRGQCEVRVKIIYKMPRHTNPDAMPADVRSKWEAMVTRMRKHEEQHGQHSINAAREIEKAGCVNGLAILRKWRAEDKAYDLRTQHGATEGVILQ